MKNYTITVNGAVYDVVVEEKGTNGAQMQSSTASEPKMTAPAAKPQVVNPVEAKENIQQALGSIKIEAGAAGKIFKVEAKIGQAVKAGDTIVILEAMKMEIPVVAAQNGVVASINVMVGDPVEAGAVLATLN